MSYDANQYERDAIECASRAVQFDREGRWEAAIYYYHEASQALIALQEVGSEFPNIAEKISEYCTRGKCLQEALLSRIKGNLPVNKHQLEFDRAKFLIHQAFDAEEADNTDEAIELYSQAVELCLQAKNNSSDPSQKQKLTTLAGRALDRAEELKGIKKPSGSPVPSRPVSPRPGQITHRVIPPLGIGNLNLDSHTKASSSGTRLSPSADPYHLQVSGNDSYTREEIEVLRLTSIINGREYVPFMTVDLKERFAYPLPFSDKDGKLVLAPKQRAVFSKWVRPDEFCQNPKMIEIIDCFSIKQTVVSDCSFVASLAISAQYEKRFRKKLIRRIIYPQNKNGDPIYNPCGKYMIKLQINGVPRKIIIDDCLPMGNNSELLCSYSTNRNELWISLLEKAYMKVMGGYDFPGSNSNIDLHALTGWIPERVAIRPDDAEFNKDKVFRKIYEKFHKGDVLVTIATGELSDAEGERAGLVPTHAYAMLDIQEVQGKHLFMLKNPWSHLRWKGHFSEKDLTHWTPELRKALNYDPTSAQMFDNGVFWIDYESICQFFDVIYMNWNPSLFKYTYCVHQTWRAGCGPIKDIYNIGENPQYSLEVRAPGASAVWILLTRHITDREDFAQNREYITVLVYKNEGKKVYYPYDPPPYKDGTRINSPHYLCKLITEQGTSRYTLVVSQYEKMNTIHYTLRVYSTCPFTLAKITNPYQHQQEITNGHWKGITAGGCGNHPETYRNNPIYQVQLSGSLDDNQLLIDLKGPKQYQIGFEVVTVSVNNPESSNCFTRKSSGPFRSGFVILPLENVPSGVYNIIPSTFLPGQEGPFFLKVQSSCPIKIVRLQ